MTLSVIPIILIGLTWGWQAGLLAGLLAFPLNAGLLWLTGNGSMEIMLRRGTVEGFAVVILVGFIVGLLRDTNERAKREIATRIQIAEALTESEERYRNLFNTVPIGLYQTSPAGEIIDMNQTLIEMLGYPNRDTLLEASAIDLYVRRGEREQWQRTVDEGGTAVIEFQSKRYDGTAIWMRDRARAVYGPSGEIVRYEGSQEDITERKQIEEAEQVQRTMAAAYTEIAATLNSSLDLEQVLDKILDNMGRVVPHDTANIMFLEAGVARIIRSRGYDNHIQQEALDSLRLPLADAFNLRQIVETQKSLIVKDTQTYPGWVPVPETQWIKSYLGTSIRIDGRIIGFLNLDSAVPGFFTSHHADVLETFANQAAVAINNARLYHELESYSQILEQAVEDRTNNLQRSKDYTEAILNSIGEAVVVIKQDGSIEQVNPAFEQQTGFSAGELEDGDHRKLLLPDGQTPDLFHDSATAMRDGKGWRGEIPVRRKDGSIYDAAVTISPLFNAEGQSIAFVGALRDISALKEVERMKDAFVSNVSHELRTPITSLKLNLAMLALDPARQTTFVERMDRDLNRLGGLIEDLLYLSRLDQDRVDLTLLPTDLSALASNYVIDRDSLAQQKQVELVFNGDGNLPPVLADKGLLEQALGVLVTNAINYTPPGGRVEISIEERQSEHNHEIGLVVTDNGPGISLAEQAQLFQRFFRGKAGHASGVSGTGLGLAIAKQIVGRHQGSIEVKNVCEPGTGAQFSIWLAAIDSAPHHA